MCTSKKLTPRFVQIPKLLLQVTYAVDSDYNTLLSYADFTQQHIFINSVI